jgi:uncharacterized protein (TIGR02996 family)
VTGGVTDRQALVAAVVARPDDDTPRLAFADWLDERDDPGAGDWAAVIRAQVEAARLERFSPRWLELARVQADLFRKHADDWVPLWSSRLGRLAFRRGFREAVEFDGRTFHNLADGQFRANPIRAVKLTQLANRAGVVIDPEIPSHPGWAGVEALDLAGNRPQVARWFLDEAAPRMPRLRVVGLRGMGLDAWEAMNLVASIRAPGLEGVDLSRNPLFETVDPTRLVHHPVMARLRWLDLQNTGVHVRVLNELMNSPHLTELRVLNLSRDIETVPPDPIGPDGIAGLDAEHGLRGLDVLDLSNQDLGPLSVAVLARWSGLASVRELRLANNRIGDLGVHLLARAPLVRNLRLLDLTGNDITDDGVETLLASPNLTGLLVLTLTIDPESQFYEPTVRRLAERFPGCFDVWSPVFEPIP